MGKKSRIKTDHLCRLLHYILGYHPYEFGLVPGLDGFIPFKDLIRAINEEKGWGHIRHGHINEVLLGPRKDLFQYDEKGIRAVKIEWVIDTDHPARSLGGLLLTPVRRRAHAHVLEKGIRAENQHFIILTHDRDMALRIGRRKDQNPVLMEVVPERIRKEGFSVYPFGDLFLARAISAGSFAGPVLSKAARKALESKEVKKTQEIPDTPAGTFILKPIQDPARTQKSAGKKHRGWKEDARKLRRNR